MHTVLYNIVYIPFYWVTALNCLILNMLYVYAYVTLITVYSVFIYYSNTHIIYLFLYVCISYRHSADATKTAIPSYIYTGYDIRQIALEVRDKLGYYLFLPY